MILIKVTMGGARHMCGEAAVAEHLAAMAERTATFTALAAGACARAATDGN
jgi:hypothetical protein